MIKRFRVVFVQLLTLICVISGGLGCFQSVLATEVNNKYNVVFVTDASKSMLDTDPSQLRYEAITQFSNLLSEQGNHVGSVVFSTGVDGQIELRQITEQATKDSIISSIKSVTPHGFTNIGQGLDVAVEMLSRSGQKDLPSVVIFLSDGETAMATDSELETSLKLKAEAIQKARDKGIKVYSVILNHNGGADTNEMKQIAQATGGEFQEVNDAKDLPDVFNSFYNLIYGTSSVPIVDTTFPANGKVETVFNVPGIGIEEINIVINGKTSAVKLYRPDSQEQPIAPIHSGDVNLIKVTETSPGKWRLLTEGAPGDQIKINLVYNPNLAVDVKPAGNLETRHPEDALTISAQLKDEKGLATKNEQYEGYQAVVKILDAYGKEIEKQDMVLKDGQFEIDQKFSEGVFHYQVLVSGHGIAKESDIIGPLTISKNAQTEKQKRNTAPKPAKASIEKTIFTFPFVTGNYRLVLDQLATDKEDKTLRYTIESSSFLEGKDYVLEGNTLTVTPVSLSKGSFDIRATDTGGLSTKVTVLIKTFNVGWLGLGGILVGLLIFAYSTYALSRKPFYGDIEVKHRSGSSTMIYKQERLKRGRLRLTAFYDLPDIGLSLGNSYFQATGKKHVYFIPDRPVTHRGQLTKKVEVRHGITERVTINDEHSLDLTFRSVKK